MLRSDVTNERNVVTGNALSSDTSISCVVEVCNVSSITPGKIPSNTVGISKEINSTNSLLEISCSGFR